MEGEPGLRIFAAGSLRPAFAVLAGEEADVRVDYANARDLAGRIVAREPADVFASASPKDPLELHGAGLVEAPRSFASNRLVVAVRATSPAEDVEVLAAPGIRVVIEVAGIPLGDYTRELLASLGDAFSERVLANLVAQEQTVDGVAARLVAGAADAGILYATDVASRPGLRGIELPPGTSVEVTCSVCVVTASVVRTRAAAWVDLLTGPAGQEVLRRAGFGPAPA
ncbi:MAG TPA: molybdate ABC transporter substrate-binding protein [Solirubrobacteraceae bacterium]|nr:molybdate ABC transporter substrate-binding protein [Solirubrobacteraceae bacterium]